MVIGQVGKSLPTRGAWIEIEDKGNLDRVLAVSLPTRGAWIEIKDCEWHDVWPESLPTRGAWIEIYLL